VRRALLVGTSVVAVLVLVGLFPVRYKHIQGSTICTARAPLAMHLAGKLTGDYDGVPLNLYYSDKCVGF
jgi:hypothetical protein